MPQSDLRQSPLILFSGLAADASILAPQKLAFPNLTVPAWPKPLEKESFEDYCQRLAAQLAPLQAALIGGVSFGGIVALHVARWLKPRGVVLIASARAPSEVPRRIKLLRSLLPLLPYAPISWIQRLTHITPYSPAYVAEALHQFRQADPHTLRWSIRQILTWQTAPAPDCPIYQIHGDRDFIFPLRRAHSTAVVKKGGHLISLTHGKLVNEFLTACLKEQKK